MKYLNCTPHPIAIYSDDGMTILLEIPPSPYTVRVRTPPQGAPTLISVNGVDVPLVGAQDFGAGIVEGLPPYDEFEQENTGIVVGVVAAAAARRAWSGPVLVTDTGPESVVRDDTGRILGVRRLQRAR